MIREKSFTGNIIGKLQKGLRKKKNPKVFKTAFKSQVHAYSFSLYGKLMNTFV